LQFVVSSAPPAMDALLLYALCGIHPNNGSASAYMRFFYVSQLISNLFFTISNVYLLLFCRLHGWQPLVTWRTDPLVMVLWFSDRCFCSEYACQHWQSMIN